MFGLLSTMAWADIDSPTTSGGAFEWLLIAIGVVLLVTIGLFYYAGFF
jgi:hypothetical protein